MQPGKPQGFGRVGEDGTPIFALPGNPVSSYVSFEVFVLPALRQLMGRTPYTRLPTRARLSHGDALGARQEAVRRARCTRSTADGAHVTPVGGHGSHLLGDLSTANALVVVPEDVEPRRAGLAGRRAAARPGLLRTAER